MTSNFVNTSPYLRTSREFPEELHQLAVEVNRSYVDIASKMNNRTISLYPTTRPAITGESWFLQNNQRQQSFRQVYNFTSNADINLGFKISSISGFSRLFGTYTDGTRWYGVIAATSVLIPGQLTFYIDVNIASTTSDVIKFVSDGSTPAISKGQLVIEWLSDV